MVTKPDQNSPFSGSSQSRSYKRAQKGGRQDQKCANQGGAAIILSTDAGVLKPSGPMICNNVPFEHMPECSNLNVTVFENKKGTWSNAQRQRPFSYERRIIRQDKLFVCRVIRLV